MSGMSVAILSKEDRQLWLNEEIWVNGITKEQRSVVLRQFADLLRSVLKQHGYDVLYEMNPYACLVKWIYAIYLRTYFLPDLKFFFDTPIHRNWKEDRMEFDYVMSDVVYEIMEAWNEVEGFDQDSSVGREIWMGLEDFLYHLADIDTSKHARRVDTLLFGADSDGSEDERYGGRRAGTRSGNGRRAQKKADDVYNQETAQGYHYDERHRT